MGRRRLRDSTTISSFYPPNIPIPATYYATGNGFKNPDGCDNGNIPPPCVDELPSRRRQRRVRRRLGAFHQELDQLVELAGHQARHG